ncbi:MAG: hypothetical protein ACE5H8_11000 [Alphaproteobacteria bacterium]
MNPLITIGKSIAVVIAVSGLAACETPPAPPLMSPWQAEIAYGYSEGRLEDDRLDVTYVSPSQSTSLNRSRREEDATAARELAVDLATWRAAEIAAREGFAAFVIEDTRLDVEVELYRDAPYFPRFGLADPVSGYRFVQDHGQDFRAAWLQARARLTVALKHQAGPGTLDAEATVARFEKKYPMARQYPGGY